MRLPSLCLIPLFLTFFSAPASGLESAPARAEFSSIRLVTGALHKSDSAAATLDAAVEVTLDKGWKTYWRSPGDAGFPMTVALENTSINAENPVIHWPYSTRFVEEWGLEVFGFKDKALIPVSISIPDPAQPTEIDLRVSYAVCSDICINQDHQVTLDIPAGYAPEERHAKRVAKAIESVPAANGTGGLKVGSLHVESEDLKAAKGVLVVEAALPMGEAAKADVFIEGPAGFRFPNPTLVWKEKGKVAVFRVPYEISPPAKSLYGTLLRLTLVQGNKAVDAEMATPEKIEDEKSVDENTGDEKADDSLSAAQAQEVQLADAAEPEKPSLWQRVTQSPIVEKAKGWW